MLNFRETPASTRGNPPKTQEQSNTKPGDLDHFFGKYLGTIQRTLLPGVKEMFTKLIMYNSSSLVFSNKTKASIIGTLINDDIASAHPLLNCINKLLNLGANSIDDLDDRLSANVDIDWIHEEGISRYFLCKGTFSLRRSQARILSESALVKGVINIFKRIEDNKSLSVLK